ncbi:MAG: hypothetical protein ABEH64_07360 [Salinirussus sp.]
MNEAWIELQCPACGEDWEANPAELPAPDERFRCNHCGEERPTGEFALTTRGFEILEEFHEG